MSFFLISFISFLLLVTLSFPCPRSLLVCRFRCSLLDLGLEEWSLCATISTSSKQASFPSIKKKFVGKGASFSAPPSSKASPPFIRSFFCDQPNFCDRPLLPLPSRSTSIFPIFSLSPFKLAFLPHTRFTVAGNLDGRPEKLWFTFGKG